MNLPNCEIIAKYADIDHDQWLACRMEGLGGSDAGAVLGISKYTSQFLLCMEKTGRVQPKDLSDNDSVYTGNKLEDIIRNEFVPEYINEKMNLDVEVINPTAMYRSKEYPFMVINVDGFLMLNDGQFDTNLVGLEIKTGSSYALPEWGGKDGDKVPPTYYAQVQHYMAGTGLDEWWTFGLIGNQRLLRIVKRNDEYIEQLIEAERELWEIIQRNDPAYFPLPLGLDSDIQAINEMGLPQSEEVADLDMNLVEKFQDVKAQIKEAEAVKKKLQAEIMFQMGACKYGDATKYKATYSRFKTSRFDKAAFGKEYPELLEKYTSYSDSGRLTIKEIK